ncbi:MAG: hypothetical protein AAB036_01335 [Elusimicrobiota bacterium]
MLMFPAFWLGLCAGSMNAFAALVAPSRPLPLIRNSGSIGSPVFSAARHAGSFPASRLSAPLVAAAQTAGGALAPQFTAEQAHAAIAGVYGESQPSSRPIEISPITTRERLREDAELRLARAGARELFAEKGLILWKILRANTRAGEKVWLSFSFKDKKASALEIETALAGLRPQWVPWLASVLDLPSQAVELQAKPIEECCGSGCQSCLRSKERSSQYWTGAKPRKKSGS